MSTEPTPILVFTTSSRLKESLVQILEPEYRCQFAHTIQEAEKLLSTQSINATIIDFTAAVDDDAITELNTIDNSLSHVVICPRDRKEELLETEISNQVYRVLFAPLSKGQTQLALQSAVKHGETSVKKVMSKPSKNSKLPLIIGASVLAVLIAFYLTRGGSEQAETELQTAVTQNAVQLTATQETEIRTFNIQANNALELSNFFPPTENNATDGFLKILELNPEDQKAKASLEQLGERAIGDLELHLGNGSVEEALSSIEGAENILQSSAQFAPYIQSALTEQKNNFIQTAQSALDQGDVGQAITRIETAKAVYSSDPAVDSIYNLIAAEKQNFDRSNQVSQLITSAQSAISSNRLLQPSGRNARYFINSLESLDPENATLATLKADLISQLILTSRSETSDNNFTNAKRLLESARTLGANASTITAELGTVNSLEAQFNTIEQARIQQEQEAREEEERLQQERERLAAEEEARRQAELSAQTAPTAEEEAKPEPPVNLNEPVDVRLSQLNITKRTSPKYPKILERRKTSGYADVEFQVDKSGVLSNVRFTETEPETASAFGREAVRAVEQWEINPYLDENGNPRIANSKVRVRFNYE